MEKGKVRTVEAVVNQILNEKEYPKKQEHKEEQRTIEPISEPIKTNKPLVNRPPRDFLDIHFNVQPNYIALWYFTMVQHSFSMLPFKQNISCQ